MSFLSFYLFLSFFFFFMTEPSTPKPTSFIPDQFLQTLLLLQKNSQLILNIINAFPDR